MSNFNSTLRKYIDIIGQLDERVTINPDGTTSGGLARPPAPAAPAAPASASPWANDPAKDAAWKALSPEDQKWLGGADPTDKFILARAPKKGAPNVPVPSPNEGPTSSAKRPVKPGTTPEKAKLDPRYKTDPAFKKEVDTASKIGVKEGKKPDFLDMDKDGDKKEPMKKAVADKKAGPKKGVNPFAKVKEAADKCNHTAKGKSCPVHGLKECGGMYEAGIKR
jgi:hypothetical protein